MDDPAHLPGGSGQHPGDLQSGDLPRPVLPLRVRGRLRDDRLSVKPTMHRTTSTRGNIHGYEKDVFISLADLGVTAVIGDLAGLGFGRALGPKLASAVESPT